MTRLIASREGAPAGELPAEVADPVRERSSLQGTERVHASVALFCGLVALGIAGIGYLARYGFSDNSLFSWAKFVGLSWFLLSFSLLVRMLRPVRDAGGPWRSWAGHASLSLARSRSDGPRRL